MGSLNNLIFIICFYELCFKSKLESSGKNVSKLKFRCYENNIETSMLFKNDHPSFASSSKISFHSSVTLLRWQVASSGYLARFSDPNLYDPISMWAAGQTSNNSVINIRWWRCTFYSIPSLALPHTNNSWLESHFILLAKIIEYAVFQLSLY